ncbi:MAG: hypothetical protein H7X94_10815, partial [Vallitaleaceae bacterium]|nr:hypothetical protein [Vallitaleaceae bacterium]
MTKKFTDVFPKLKLSKAMADYFNNCLIENIYMDQRKNHLHVSITMDQIVFPQLVERLAQEIKDHLSLAPDFKVTVSERFHLSFELPFHQLYELYKGAIFYELNAINPVCGVKLAHSEYAIEGQTVFYEMDEQLYEYLNKYNVATKMSTLFKDKFSIEMQMVLSKKEGKDLVEKFLERHDLEQKMLIQELQVDQNVHAGKALPK